MNTARTALITGGAGGIGTVLSAELSARGYQVVVADLIEPPAGDAAFIRTDVTDATSLERAVDHATSVTGRLDHVFLNAGVTTERVHFGERIDVAAYHRAVAVNLDGIIFGVNAALPVLRDVRNSSIVVTASLAGMMPVATDPIYSATKHAVVGFVRSIGPSAAPVRINAVCPTFTDTPILDGIRQDLALASTLLLAPQTVAKALADVANSKTSGECFYVQVGRPVEPFKFQRPPGPRPFS